MNSEELAAMKDEQRIIQAEMKMIAIQLKKNSDEIFQKLNADKDREDDRKETNFMKIFFSNLYVSSVQKIILTIGRTIIDLFS